MVAAGERYRTAQPVPVIVWWEADTVAILVDYSECHHSQLPAGETFEVDEIKPEGCGTAICRLDRERGLLDLLIPRQRQNRILCFRLPTPYRVEIELMEFASRCEGPLTTGCS